MRTDFRPIKRHLVILSFSAALSALISFYLIPRQAFLFWELVSKVELLLPPERVNGLVTAAPGIGSKGSLLIRGGMLFDGENEPRPNNFILIQGGRIKRIAQSPDEATPVDSQVIDAHGMTILPGLIDMHTHLMPGSFMWQLLIANGVTAVRDLGANLRAALMYRRRMSEGGWIGPRMFVTGPYLVARPTTSDQEIFVETPEEASYRVKQLARAGVDGITARHSVTAELYAAITESARSSGLWVAAHLGRTDLEQAAALGVDTIEHGGRLIQPVPADDPDELLDSEVNREPDADRVARLIEIMVRKKVAFCPLLVRYEHRARINEPQISSDPNFKYVPLWLRSPWMRSQRRKAHADQLDEREKLARLRALKYMQGFTARLHRAGGLILAGTDSAALLIVPGFSLHRELELLVEAGLSPRAAIQAATRNAAIALGKERDLGTVAEGKIADIILVEGDPLADIRATRNVRLVISSGRVLFAIR